ncbi:MAG: hypothetical protein KGS44_08125, partial [Alphaproteobacteria bacterium]|nr:hypothetical protein [Alphaproteobacteria bacterium]
AAAAVTAAAVTAAAAAAFAAAVAAAAEIVHSVRGATDRRVTGPSDPGRKAAVSAAAIGLHGPHWEIRRTGL